MRYLTVIIVSAVSLPFFQTCTFANDRVVEKLEITSSAFREGGVIPGTCAKSGSNISPDINWSKPPIGTKCMAIICEDPDAPSGIWTHWVAFNIPYKPGGILGGIPPLQLLNDGSMQGLNDFGNIGYDGPHPPFGTHRYYFKVYALDTRPNIAGRVTREELLEAMEGNILAEGSLMGTYSK